MKLEWTKNWIQMMFLCFLSGLGTLANYILNIVLFRAMDSAIVGIYFVVFFLILGLIMFILNFLVRRRKQ